MKRFDKDANTIEEAKNYIRNRAIQMLKYNLFLESMTELEYGIEAKIVQKVNGVLIDTYHALYILKDFAGKGVYAQHVKEAVSKDPHYKIITHTDCDISSYLMHKKIAYDIVGNFDSSPYYLSMQGHYSDDKARRSQQYLMNHIDEGVAILEWIGASERAKAAYTIHPIMQDDTMFEEYISKPSAVYQPKVIAMAVEYRSVANEYLSSKSIDKISDIRLSPLKDVNDMLIADKIQNYKDFELYHKGIHKRSKELDQYFKNWLDRLKITPAKYEEIKSKLTII